MPTISENFNALLNAVYQAADADERFQLANKAWTANNPVGINLEDVAENRRKLLFVYKDLAKGGHVGAMFASAMINASGEANQEFKRTERPQAEGYEYLKPVVDITVTNYPDYEEALKWCELAAKAGHEGAKAVLPRIQKAAGVDPKI